MTYDPDTENYNSWADPRVVLPWLQKKRIISNQSSRDSVHKEFDREFIGDEKTLAPFKPRIAFRDISRATDTRTVRCALIPPNVFITNTGPVILFPRGDEKDEAYLLGILSSTILDWYARRFVENHLNFFIFNPLPIPRPERSEILWKKTVELSGRLACPDERFADWASKIGVQFGPLEVQEKESMINELDAVTAHLYGLNKAHLSHIFETFHNGWNYEPKLKEVLKQYDKWTEKF